jgi:hypothetical protein
MWYLSGWRPFGSTLTVVAARAITVTANTASTGTACLTTTLHHSSENSDQFGCILETFVVHSFLRIVHICDSLFG